MNPVVNPFVHGRLREMTSILLQAIHVLWTRWPQDCFNPLVREPVDPKTVFNPLVCEAVDPEIHLPARSLTRLLSPRQNPEDREVPVDDEEVIRILDPRLANRSTATIPGTKLPRTRLLLTTWYPSHPRRLSPYAVAPQSAGPSQSLLVLRLHQLARFLCLFL